LIFERPRPLSRQRRANHLYTLICEEPLNGMRGLIDSWVACGNPSAHEPSILVTLSNVVSVRGQ
ncbi:hypothetical protein, partial [Mycobacteroides abscessus]|uniref:hypothetical protein n=1 Tax=Mycobacteroides abscessus TaxID=36809 RepID=UPI001C25CB82